MIDFKHSINSVNLKKLTKNDPRIKVIRTSTAKASGTTRMVIELTEDYQITVFPLAPAGKYSNRLVVDLYDKNKKINIVKQTDKNTKRDVVIAIVAGHGGEDPGSIGARGTYEKRVTLKIAKELEKLINAQKGMDVVSTLTAIQSSMDQNGLSVKVS